MKWLREVFIGFNDLETDESSSLRLSVFPFQSVREHAQTRACAWGGMGVGGIARGSIAGEVAA